MDRLNPKHGQDKDTGAFSDDHPRAASDLHIQSHPNVLRWPGRLGNPVATMLNIKGLKDSGGAGSGSPGAVISYLQHTEQQHVARNGATYTSGYYAGSAPSQWHGNLAGELGLSGPVKTADLESLLSGETPAGQTFGSRQGDRARRMANDLTISAPKSVSIQALAVGDNSVIEAHDRAIATALKYVEREIISSRHGRGGEHSRKSNNAAIAAYRHEDARPVDDLSDPDLHTHAIAINVTTDANGNYRASDLDFGSHSIKMHIADYIYKAALSSELENLGYQTRRTRHGFELANISDEQIAAFSRRGQQVKDDLALNEQITGIEHTSRAQTQKSVLFTRAAKGDLGRDELRATWKTAAEQAGVDITPHEFPASTSENAVDVISADSDPEDRAIDEALAHLDERDAVHSVEQIYYQSLVYGMGQVNPDRIRERLDEREDLHHTTAGIVSDRTLIAEDSVIHGIDQGRGAHMAMLTEPAAQRSISDTEERAGIQYSDDQRRAAIHALTSEDQITGIVGAAGSGKTTAIRTVVNSARARGYEIVGLAPSAAAAEELTGAGADSTGTLAGHNLKGKPDADAAPRWYVFDEAAMVSTRDMQAFVETLRPQDRVLLSGDPRQLQAVESGAPFAQAIREGVVDVAHMTEIRRQTDPGLKEIAQAFAEGRAQDGAHQAIRDHTETVTIEEGSDANGKPLASERRQAIADRAADAYLEQSSDDRNDTLVLAGNNDVRQTINARIRAGLVDEGRVDTDSEITVQTLEKTSPTSAQRRDITNYQPGLVIRSRDGDADVVGHDAVAGTVNLRSRETGDTRDVSVENLADPKTRIYQASERQIAPGDALVVTENDKQTGIRNGDRLSIDSVNPDTGAIRATRQGDSKAIELDGHRAQAVDYGWATTVHKSQGATAERTIVAGAANKVATAEQAYVACSRERSSLQIITDNPGELQKRWEKFATNGTGRDAVAEGNEQQSDGEGIGGEDRAEMRAAAVARAAIERAQATSLDQGEAEPETGQQGGGDTETVPELNRDEPIEAETTSQDDERGIAGDTDESVEDETAEANPGNPRTFIDESLLTTQPQDTETGNTGSGVTTFIDDSLLDSDRDNTEPEPETGTSEVTTFLDPAMLNNQSDAEPQPEPEPEPEPGERQPVTDEGRDIREQIGNAATGEQDSEKTDDMDPMAEPTQSQEQDQGMDPMGGPEQQRRPRREQDNGMDM